MYSSFIFLLLYIPVTSNGVFGLLSSLVPTSTLEFHHGELRAMEYMVTAE